jgi:hypothetical protein
VGVEGDPGGVRSGAEGGRELLPVGGGLGPGGDVGGAGAARAEVDVGAADVAGQRVLRARLHAHRLGALGVVAAGRGGLQRRGAAVHG